MRPFPQSDLAKTSAKARGLARLEGLAFLVVVAMNAYTLGCAGVGGKVQPQPTPAPTAAPGPSPTPAPASVDVTVTPSSAAVLLGNSQAFAAAVANGGNTGVTWSVNGVPGGNAAVGTITVAGVYTAPVDLPASTLVQVMATSVADATKSATANVTIGSDVQVSIGTSAASVELGATRSFRASIASGGHPDPAIRWTLSGAACPAACGAVDASGNFTAPQILPSPATVTLTARSVADPSREASATVTITSNFTLQITAPGTVAVSGSATIAAIFMAVPGSNPAETLAWSLAGSGCSGATCGVLTVVTQQSAGGEGVGSSATYQAPATAPAPDVVTIAVTPLADPSKKTQATVVILAGGSVSVSPATATVAANHRVTLTAQVAAAPGGSGSGGAAAGVTWSVNGIAGGNSAVGEICVVATNPCVPVTSGTAAQVDYLAPGSLPSPNPVTVQATNAADSTQHGSAQITVINHVVVTVLPGSATLAPLAAQGFTATVIGTGNQSVVWQVQGAACTGGAGCGSITTNGVYTAPDAAPSPDTVEVVAISADDSSQSGSATVTISTGANILTLHPASVYAGGADGFTLRVDGSGFAAASPGPGSVVVIAGTARTTTCNSSAECTAPVTAADVASAGNISVQVQNPDGTSSSVVSLVVAEPNHSDEVITLSGGSAVATGIDIVVVEPTTAGVSTPSDDVDLNVEALGSFSAANNSCSLTGNPVALVRPASGSSNADICLFSESGLDTSMTFTVSGPGDVAVVAKQPVGLGIVRLTLQIPVTAAPGPRTLFIQNVNLDKTAASGALVVF
jgi:hypothetical protein